MSFDPHALKLYIDGSCLGNPGGRGGFATWAEYPSDWNCPDELLDSIGFESSTNNRMELKACIWACRWIRDNVHQLGVQRVQIVTDSKYVHDYWRFAAAWRSQKWRNVDNRPIENPDLWKEFLAVRSKLNIRTDIIWTAGKKSPILKSVDKSAKAAASAPTKVDRGFRPGKVGKTKVKVTGAAKPYPADGASAQIRIYQSSMLRGGENKIKFQLYSEAIRDYVEKYVAYAHSELGARLHRHHAYRVQFNANLKYPVIKEILDEA